MKFIHLNYHCHTEYTDPSDVLKKHRLSSGFTDFLKRSVQLVSVKHMDHKGRLEQDGIAYHFFRSRNRSWHIPFPTHRFIAQQQPDVVLIEGFVFPLQLIFLRRTLGPKPVFIVQHHGERPQRGWKGRLQQWVDRCIDAYIFTSVDNARPWLERGIIGGRHKCFEILSASTQFQAADRLKSRCRLGISGDPVFLWVAHLSANKDPLTVLQGFSMYAARHPQAKLYMIYQLAPLLEAVSHMIGKNTALKNTVHLVGAVPHDDLETWFSAADFYLSGSHREGSGYALVEAMTCGCIPIVTDIPSFSEITQQGKYGFLFPTGNAHALFDRIEQASLVDRISLSKELIAYSKKELSCEAISNQLLALCHRLLRQ